MKPAAFDYAAPTRLADAIDLLVAHADAEPRVLAGGQSLVPLMNFRLAQPGFLVDLQHVDGLSDIRLTDDELVIGAMVRQSTAEESADAAAGAPLLVEALGHVAHPPIRNSGTIGGSIAHADPSAELPAVALALDATMTAAGPGGERRIPAAEFFRGPFETALGPDEILTEVRLPRRPGGHAFVEHARTHGGFAVVAVAVDLAVDDAGTVTRAAIALSGVGPTPIRATATEQALVGTVPDAESIRSAVAATVAVLSPAGDVHGSSETKVDMARSYLRRGIELALDRAASRR
ncbi:carbon monoxide dehydrogenase, medium subunit [Pseudonocardia thermophila]|uniref:Carbon monoxide dehydrogenase, medium subunit n=1 Tax=Pseudonocardia thermophila TaxID=1848 RepID=A0A1M6PMG6_PSETH|nr:xanthine dehydrogenase family protein subunit M [Pseudonocardia thermophila]SHK09067.1 carbon monoxide dehydrogenase, medium subunit [Pseudonocardia thermophila]